MQRTKPKSLSDEDDQFGASEVRTSKNIKNRIIRIIIHSANEYVLVLRELEKIRDCYLSCIIGNNFICYLLMSSQIGRGIT